MATPTTNGHAETGELSAAQKLMQKHHADEAHKATIEDVVDESDLSHPETPTTSSVLEDRNDTSAPSWNVPMSAKAAGKQKAPESQPHKIDTSQDAFPELGGASKAQSGATPTWGAKTNGSNGFTNGSAPTSGAATPTSRSVPAMKAIPGREQERISLSPDQLMPRSQLKRPVADVIKDINRKSKANVTMTTGANGILFLNAVGPRDACRTALNDITNQIGSKQSIDVPIPASARAHIIGKGGATIKSLQERTGARIQMPRSDVVSSQDDDDDATVDVHIEGNALTAEMARKEILKLAGERAAASSAKLRGVPAEIYPFLAARAREIEEANQGMRIQVPQYHRWTSQRPPATGFPASFTASRPDHHISLFGDRQAVNSAKAQLELQARELARQLAVENVDMSTGQQQFIIGDKGIPAEQFLAETGCHIILPSDPDDDTVTIIGPSNRIQGGVDKAIELATSMISTPLDIAKQHRPAGSSHALNVTRYLQQRQELERLQRAHNAHIITPLSSQDYVPWQMFTRDGSAAIRAQSEINSIVKGHPPSRMANVPVDPFYHAHLRKHVAPRVQENHGVLLVIPDDSTGEVLLVFEGPNGSASDYQLPRTQPSAAEVTAFQRGLEDARNHILELIEAQEAIISQSIDVPQKFHEKLRKFIKGKQEKRPADQIPIRVSATGTVVTLRGPSSSVKLLAAEVEQYIAQETELDKERGFQMSFDFPQKHANQLIGSKGAHINQLREKHDVDIQLKDGVVELTGPKVKAEAAKAEINALAKQWADTVTHVLKVDPSFHRNIIGRGGEQINRLQDRYKVDINFPRTAKPTQDDDPMADNASEVASKPKRVQLPDEVYIRGPTRGANEARDEILSLLQYLKDTSNTATVVVPQSHVGSLMGAGGKGIEEIRATTGATINVPNSKEDTQPSDLVEIEIKGTKAQVAAAKKALETKKAVLDATVSKSLNVDKKHHSALIGAGGNTLRDIIVNAGGPEDRGSHSRTVQFPKAAQDGNEIRIVGDEDVVDKIIAAMQELVLQRESQVTETIDVPVNKHRNLIGKGGNTKKEMETKFKVSINVPRAGDGSTAVRIVGQPAAVEAAKAYILDQVKEAEGETVLVPRNLHHIVADNGQFFRRLRNNKVIVDHAGHEIPIKPTIPTGTPSNGRALPLITDDETTPEDAFVWNVAPYVSAEEGEIPWILRGPPDNVTQARAQLAAAITEAQKNDSAGYLILDDPSLLRFIIGQKGKKIDQIRAESGCRITVPREPGSMEPVEVIGTKEAVEKAKELMLEAIRG